MNLLSAFDLVPIALILLYALDQLRQTSFLKTPVTSALCMFIALGAFKKCALILHGLSVAWWVLAIDVVLAAIFGFLTYSHHLKSGTKAFQGRSKPTIIQR